MPEKCKKQILKPAASLDPWTVVSSLFDPMGPQVRVDWRDSARAVGFACFAQGYLPFPFFSRDPSF